MRSCPLCWSPGVVEQHGVFGFVATCGHCYDPDPDCEYNIHGHGATREEAVESWLDRAEEWVDGNGIPDVRPPVYVSDLYGELALQVADERLRQEATEVWWHVDGKYRCPTTNAGDAMSIARWHLRGRRVAA